MSERSRRPELVIALFVTILWAAVVFAGFGLIAVVLDRDPIGVGVGPYFAVFALLFSALLVWIVLAASARSSTPWFAAIGAAAGVYLVLVGSALFVGFGLVLAQAQSPFVIFAAVLAGATVVATWAVLRRDRLSQQ